MPTLRMVQVEVEFGDPATCAEIIRLALGGEPIAPADLPEPADFRFRAPVPALAPPPGVQETNDPPPPVKHRGGPRAKAAAGAPAQPPPAGGPRDKVLAILNRGPRSSRELIGLTGLEAQQVYGACNQLSKTGLIHGKECDAGAVPAGVPEDGVRRWFVGKG